MYMERIEKREEYRKKLAKAKILCIQGKYDEAKTLYDEYVEENPDYFEGYVGYVRVASENFTVFDGDEIEKAISTLFAVCPKIPDGAAEEFLDYLVRRDLHDCDIEDGVLVKYNGSAEHLTIPGEFVSEIGEDAFRDNSTLVSIVLSKGVKIIGDGAFYCCEKLEKVEFLSGTRIGVGAFEGCENLKKVILGNNIREIGVRAFLATGRNALSRIFIPSSIEKIAMGAFRDSEFEIFFAMSEEECKAKFKSLWSEVYNYWPRDSTYWNAKREDVE